MYSSFKKFGVKKRCTRFKNIADVLVFNKIGVKNRWYSCFNNSGVLLREQRCSFSDSGVVCVLIFSTAMFLLNTSAALI